ncbi:MAG: hypothetical protein RMY16_29340 [Nostoc sp. DedQUE12b]|uniref:hypothetical protein n=1 Tax=Nostoc sp. DedQUE12b TaxID=3075398 RepID=UPI002AD1E3FB|nr:hypothetical protein [Nostoc sp. DedQUE12b]MDZ8089625.1 hypothetical protein [Nostoc sp. DedQUE12b]
MKLLSLLDFAHILNFSVLPSIARTQIATYRKSGTSINTSVKSDTLRNDSTNINCLKTFDTAVLAYQMMGLSNFE